MENNVISYKNGDFRVIHSSYLSECKESLLRQQTILMINKNLGHINKIKEVVTKFIKDIKE